ncbi:MAG: ABC transporter permease [Acidimicrobiia bacterium]
MTATTTAPIESRLRAMASMYVTLMKTSIIAQFQYRAANYFYMIGMVVEPVVYLVVWSTIARSQGGSVEGFTPGTFAAYYIVWTLVRNMNIVFTPFGWEQRIKEGEFAGQLLKPVHPIHYDLGSFAGWKVVVIILWLPIAGVLTIAFHPELSPSLLQCVVFFVAIWGAYLIRSLVLWALGMITFWTTRVSAIYEAYFLSELLLSGRLVPMRLLPQWARSLSWAFPFQWTFGFPITALTGPISDRDLVIGLGMQALWIAIGGGIVALVWRRAVAQFSSVGG